MWAAPVRARSDMGYLAGTLCVCCTCDWRLALISKGRARLAARVGAQPIKHNIETFTLFDKLKIDPPMTTDDLPATLERLRASVTHLELHE
eukprot:933129-Amphidinium_carterae.1